MNKKIRWLAVIMVCVLLIMAQASAQRIVFVGEKCPLHIIDPNAVAAEEEEDQPQEEVASVRDLFNINNLANGGAEGEEIQRQGVSVLDIFGWNAEGNLVVLCNGDTAGYISQNEIEEMLPTLDLSEVGEWTYPETVDNNNSKEGVFHFQELLATLNYDVGTPDGIAGQMTKDALTAFQTDMGLEANGAFDLITQLALEAAATFDESNTSEMLYPLSNDPALLYKAIYGNVKQNLQAFADAGWLLSYDEFEGKGELKTRAQLGGYANDTTQVDRLQLTSKLIIRIDDVLTGTARIYPALCVMSKGASSVYMRSLDIKRGSDVAKLELIESTRSLDGLDLYEEAYFMITDEALDVMRDLDKGELNVRLNCQNDKFMLFGADDDKKIENFCNVCLDAGL